MVDKLSRLSPSAREGLIGWLIRNLLREGVDRFAFDELHERFGISSLEFDDLINSDEFRDAMWDHLRARRIYPAWLRAKLSQAEAAAGGHLESAKQMFKREYEETGSVKLTQTIEGDLRALRDFVRGEALGG